MNEKESIPKPVEAHTVVEAIAVAHEALDNPPHDSRVHKDGDLAIKLYQGFRSDGFGYREDNYDRTARVLKNGRTALHEVSDSQYGHTPKVQAQSARTQVPREGGKPTRYETSTSTASRTDYVGGDDFESKTTGWSKTTITRHDKKGKEVYRFVSSKPEIAQKVGSIAAREIIGEARKHLDKEKDLTESIEKLDEALPNMARGLIPLHKLDGVQQHYVIDGDDELAIERARDFRNNPDNPAQHSEKWHQHGIITHSREFARVIKETIPGMLEEWGFGKQAELVLAERIDGAEKRQLLEMASLLHDVGKFSARTEEHDRDNDKITYSFTDHEEHSGKIIRGGQDRFGKHGISNELKDLGLTNKQIEYISRCAELHFELGKVRRVSKENGGYTMSFVDTPAFHDVVQEIIDTNPDFALEIGLMFIADGLSKSDVVARGQTDAEIASQRPVLEKELAEKGLNPQLINQALQMPVNLKAARTYLTQWASTGTVSKVS